jgi:hypothetical protein
MAGCPADAGVLDQRIERDEQVEVGRGDIHRIDILHHKHAL